ncbi:MAG TPA: diguanylate cyclase [Acidimicrobiales bacterium]|nr:diguanylate cyclase [Acidimicrobiales bacterium]
MDERRGRPDPLHRLPPVEAERVRRLLEDRTGPAPASEPAGHRDDLTWLLNRAGFIAAAEPYLAWAADAAEQVQLVRIDVDGLAAYCEAHGPEAGDAVLRCVAQTVHAGFRSTDVQARVGDDDFAVLCIGSATPDQLRDRVDAGYTTRSVGLPRPPRLVTVVVAAGGGIPAAALLDAGDEAVAAAQAAAP